MNSQPILAFFSPIRPRELCHPQTVNLWTISPPTCSCCYHEKELLAIRPTLQRNTERQKDILWCYIPPVNALIVVGPLLFNVGLPIMQVPLVGVNVIWYHTGFDCFDDNYVINRKPPKLFTFPGHQIPTVYFVTALGISYRCARHPLRLYETHWDKSKVNPSAAFTLIASQVM